LPVATGIPLLMRRDDARRRGHDKGPGRRHVWEPATTFVRMYGICKACWEFNALDALYK
jgi:hypothetical protein